MYCQLTSRQKLLYQALKNKISIEDLLQSSMGSTQQAQTTTSSLMNLVMQFRKVRAWGSYPGVVLTNPLQGKSSSFDAQ